MIEKNSRAEGVKGFAIPTAAEFAAMGKKRIEEFVDAQAELLDELQATNRQWFDRVQSEVSLASEFVSKLSQARLIPDAMTACQEWAGRRVEMMAADGKHILADLQKRRRDLVFRYSGRAACAWPARNLRRRRKDRGLMR